MISAGVLSRLGAVGAFPIDGGANDMIVIAEDVGIADDVATVCAGATTVVAARALWQARVAAMTTAELGAFVRRRLIASVGFAKVGT